MLGMVTTDQMLLLNAIKAARSKLG